MSTPLNIKSRITLQDGKTMPLLGLGVWAAQSGKETYDAVLHALKIGYRHIDTAEMYGNEKDVGDAVKDSGINRGEIFIHWPDKRSQLETWRALERIHEEGRCRSIGVSNFGPDHLKEIFENSKKRPVVNQIELSPFLQQAYISSFCRKENIHLTGYCPLARGKRFEDSQLCKVALETNKTAAQIMIRWAIQHGQTIIPKSVRPERIEENANVFDFSLNKNQMSILNGLEEGLRFCPDPLAILTD